MKRNHDSRCHRKIVAPAAERLGVLSGLQRRSDHRQRADAVQDHLGRGGRLEAHATGQRLGARENADRHVGRVGRRLDSLIVRTVPGVNKAVKWNSPLYGRAGDTEEKTWFLSIHCFTKYVRVGFFKGALLRPAPPVPSKIADVRYFDIHEDDTLDEAQFAAWVKQASKLRGERM